MSKIQYEIDGKIARITLDDGKVNAMNWEFFNELNEALDRTIADKAAALIFTSRPGVFSAGLDLKLLPTQDLAEQIRFQRKFAETMLRIYQFPVPSIVAFTGHAIAGGVILSSACDRIMISDGPYTIQINEVANKMVIPSWITLICRSSIPHQYWKEALLHSTPYSPKEAYDIGIVDDLIEEGIDIMTPANEYARKLVKLHTPAYAATKKFLRQEESAHVMEIFEKEFLDWRLNYSISDK
ncbi:MAG: enoyl-CoA hydratase/isomerase family protein [Proteobacteria bacterium]|nr:enoyl-CoA hydratase/isomerase family protein [Pseudomonadota bacterium]MBU1389786.1 enoyl-CoA hydratase/isomerase family protein [Pseudomonadota bacterium]MBU1543795.1 enoyl-CoA hydratase/isomerase family protein [Pseudomonadota bacterium]MBU2480715.1 enoyl-CoA hydratase/isomerase family protein [Pseudomonadota bacterium]